MLNITFSRFKKALLQPGAAILYLKNYLKGEWLRFYLTHPFLFIFYDRRKKINFEKLSEGIFFTDNKEFLEEISNQDFIIKTANRILNNEFGFLGIKPKILKEINWQEDIKSNHCWSNDFYLDLRESLVKDYNKGWDIKNVWELSRFHYLIPLALAFYKTGEEKYLIKWQELIESWFKNNPLYYGPNWLIAMEVAIRACNWILSFEIINSKLVTCNLKLKQGFLEDFLSSLFEHGRFIFNNLEYAPLRSNHYLSDIIGLIYLGVFFKNYKFGKRWLKFGIKELEKEIKYQVYEDGVDYELSISYHRYKLELFLWAAWLYKLKEEEIKKLINKSLSNQFWRKLQKMIDFSLAYLKPNGFAPQIGDSDNSRLFLIFEDFYNWESRNHFALKKLAKKVLGEKIIEKKEKLVNFYQDSGFLIIKDKDFYFIFGRKEACYKKGGSHTHNDILSFELNINSEDIIIDPGTYVYSSDIKERNRFRSTRAHNVCFINNEEQNPILKDPFYYPQLNNLKNISYKENKNEIYILSEFKNYQRKFVINIKEKSLLIKDRIYLDKGELEWNFHLSENIKVWLKKENTLKKEIILIGEKGSYLFTAPLELNCVIIEDEISPSYGVKIPSKTVRFSGFLIKDKEFEFKIEAIK